jgi:hypothetical protein
LVEVPGLAVFQQPAIHDLHASHTLEDAGHHDLCRHFAVSELHFKAVSHFDAIQAAAVDISRVHQVIIAGDEIDVPIV